MMSYNYLATICVILVSTKLLSLLTGRLQMPQVVGSLLAGLLLGPAVFNVLQPNNFLSQLAELGVIVIMFSAGTGTSLQDLKNSGKSGLLVAMMGVLIPLGLGALLMGIFNPGESVLQNIFMGTVLTATSVSITVETLKEIGKLNTRVGNTILAAALIDDVLGLICLTIVTSLAGAKVSIGVVLLKIVLFFVFVIVLGFIFNNCFTWYMNYLENQNLHRFPIAGFALCLFMAWAAEEIFGVADIIGAFAAGVIVATTPKGSYIASKFAPLSYLLLTPIFFANIGLKVTLPQLSGKLVLFTVLLVVIGILSKLLGCGFGAKVSGFNNRQAVQIGFGMACRGEVALITANKGMAMGLLNEEYFGPVIILIVCCAVFTPILLKVAFKNYTSTAQDSTLVEHYELSQAEIEGARAIRPKKVENKK
ncbi:MAG: cation:proton antiporter [Clostridiales bacterium]|nr:cation:proton antiporter [Clostridiales bacterium]